MKIIVAPDSFKECMSARSAAETMKDAIHKVDSTADTTLLPIADGGEGTLDALTYTTDGIIHEADVTGPLGETVRAKYAILGNQRTAVVEMAEASGIHLVAPVDRNPLRTTTFGTGELIREALNHDISKIIVTIGGSATNDAGSGMLQALGASFTDEHGTPIGFGGGELGKVRNIDLSKMDQRLQKVELIIACDVTNPLIGEKGASAIFGPQKGATEEMVEQLEQNINHFARQLLEITDVDIIHTPGAGAAGGLGAALLLCGGKIQSGIDLVLDVLHFNEKIADADYIFTGEGKIDHQTPDGKVIAGISNRGRGMGVPVIAFAGSVSPGYEALLAEGLYSVFSITQGPCTLEEALTNGRTNLAQTVENVIRLL